MSGLEARGIGGGAAILEDEGLAALPFTLFIWHPSSAFIIPTERPGLAGIGGGRSGEDFLGGPLDSCLAGRLGGKAGVVGAGRTSIVVV